MNPSVYHPHTKCSHASWITQVQRGDVHLIKVLDNSFIFQFVPSIFGQSSKEVLLLIVLLLYQPLREVHHPILQEVI